MVYKYNYYKFKSKAVSWNIFYRDIEIDFKP